MMNGITETEKSDQDLTKKVGEVINKNFTMFEVSLTGKDTLGIERMGRPKKDRPRTLRVVFKNDWHKCAIIRNRANLKDTKIHMNEELSTELKTLEFNAREAFKANKKIARVLTRRDNLLVM